MSTLVTFKRGTHTPTMRTFLLCLFVVSSASAEVRVERVPEGGVQPQVVQSADGTVHLVYLKGEPGSSDVRYVNRKGPARKWSEPVSVNSEPKSAVSAGTIRGAQIALGKDDTLHIVWNGRGGKGMQAALNYAHSTGAGFTAQHDLREESINLDGGASIAADAKGRVSVMWHGAAADATPGEQNRVVFVKRSEDNGATFGPAKIANPADKGVCACCSLKAFATPDGELLALYRAARSREQRDMVLLRSTDGGATFKMRTVGAWRIAGCPMSSMTILGTGSTLRGAWESEGRIETALLGAGSKAQIVSPEKSRHPALAVNSRGETLVSWSVGTGWMKGGDLQWRILDARGTATDQQGSAKGVPVWDFTAAYADGENFVVLF